MNLESVIAVIESAKARGIEPLDRFIGERMPGATPAQVREASEVALEIIETVPIMLARASQEASERNLAIVVQPLLDHAVHYFLRPVDLVPEMTMGLAGLLDDTYLVLKVLENLQKGPDPLLDWDLEHPMDFIATLVGPDLQRQLDSISVNALLEISDNVSRLWQNMARDA